MELIANATGAARAWAPPRLLASRVDPPAISAWALAFTLVTYLALRNGGYDTVVHSEVAVLVWWIVLLGAVAGIIPGRISGAGWVALGLLGAFTLWTGVATTWSDSAERSVLELTRVAAYLGVLIVALALQGRTAARHTINGLACAIGLITVLAVLSRLHPHAFPVNDHFQFLGPGSARKLSYPLNYWNALAAFAAMGVPLLLAVALGARSLAGQAFAAATLPLSALCVYLTISRGGALAIAAGVFAFLLLVPRRLDALATLLVGGAASAILIHATSTRDALTSGVPSAAATDEGTQILLLGLLVCAGVGLIQVAIGLSARHVARPRLLAPDPRATAVRALAVLAVTLVLGVAIGAPGELESRWRDFKAPVGQVVPASDGTVFSRLEAANGNGRYQFWRAAVDANATAPWTGTGPGTFEFRWSRHATNPGFVRNAHSLYFETLAETGIIGLALLGGLLLWLLGVAVRRSLRAPANLRIWLAGASGGLVAFMASATIEWVWQMATIAVAVMAIAAVIVAGRDDRQVESAPTEGNPPAGRVVVGLVAIVALISVLVPLAGTLAVNKSRTAAANGDLTAALRHSRTAERLQPYAATPHLQRALLLETAGAFDAAAEEARTATRDESTNWRTWLTLARIDARRGESAAAIRELRRARQLNPWSTLFLTS